MVDFRVDDAKTSSIGADVLARGPSVTLRLRVTTAEWQNVTRLNVWRNGLLVNTRSIEAGRNLATNPYEEDLTVELARDAGGAAIDSWFVVEAIGNKSLFPVVAPAEVPPVLLTEAIASLAGPLGLSSSSAGSLEPPKTFAVFPFAITNPVWVRTSAAPFRAPGVQPFAAIDDPKNEPGIPYDIVPRPEYAKPAAAQTQTRRTDAIDYRRVVPLFYPRSQNPYDIRKVLSRIGHAGGHVE